MKYKKVILTILILVSSILFCNKVYANDDHSEFSELINDKNYYKYREENVEKRNSNLLMNTYQNSELTSSQQSVVNFILEESKKNVDQNVFTNTSISENKIRILNIRNYPIKFDDIDKVLTSIYEHPEMFYCAEIGTNAYYGNEYVEYIVITYYLNQAEINEGFKIIEKETTKFLNTVDTTWTDLEKILHTHDYICKLVNYNFDACDEEEKNNEIVWKIHRLYGALVEKSPVCDGYSRTYVHFLNKLGINSSLVTSYEMNHAWNMVRLNGSYYHVDVTWDDIGYNGRTIYNYFLISDTEITTNREHNNYITEYTANNILYDSNQIWNNTVSYLTYYNDNWYYLSDTTTDENNPAASEIILNKADINNNRIKNTKTITSNLIKEKIVSAPCLTTDGRYFYFNGINGFYRMNFEDNIIKEYYITSDMVFDMVYFDGLFYYDIIGLQNEQYVPIQKIYTPISDIKLSNSKIEKDIKEKTYTLTATLSPAKYDDSPYITWQSSDYNIVKVNSSGKLEFIAPGKVIITATTSNGITASCEVIVHRSITSFELNHQILLLNKGNKEKLTTTILPKDTTQNKTVTWNSSNSNIVEVNNEGEVIAKSAGTATITASLANGMKKTCSITVRAPLTGIKLNKENITLNISQKDKLTATLLPTDTTDNRTITWKSSNPGIVEVDNAGNIKAKSAGTTTITATAINGKTATCNVNVKLPFTDINNKDWYYNAVTYSYSNNIIRGYNEETFAPNDKLTRGMLVTIIYRMECEPAVSGKTKFSDVKDSKQYYYKAVKWATDKNIVSGYENGKFGPNDNVTREQVAVILNKYAKYKGKNTSATNDLKSFKDKRKISDYAVNQMKWAVGAGVITGNANKTLNPKGNATRAEVAAMLEKYCKKIGR